MADSVLLAPEAIRLHESAADRTAAIRRCGQVLAEIGAVSPEYTAAMLTREESISTFVGEGVAIPHGTLESKAKVHKDALAVVRFPDGVDWAGDQVTVCVAIAARGDGHVALLGSLAEILLDPDAARSLRAAERTEEVIRLLSPVGKENRA